MKCKNCKTENPKNSKYCSNCGQKIIRTCYNCNAELIENDKYCPECGNQIDDRKSFMKKILNSESIAKTKKVIVTEKFLIKIYEECIILI